MPVLRSVLVALVVASAAGLTATAALASCIGPQSVSEYAERAEAIVYGRVTGAEGPPGIPARYVFVQVGRVLKGRVVAPIGVSVGPDLGPGAGATSVDYTMERGTDHTLYLKKNAPAGYTTDACSGSYPGAPTADEERLFGPGGPDRAPTGLDATTTEDRVIAAVATLAALAAGAAAIWYARRSARRVPAS